jgi:hypothetical protein
MNKYKIQRKFITPRAAWHGGMWERLIGIMKSCMKKVIGKSLLSLEELITLTTQVEAKMNDRPLTYLSDDRNDLQPLTPSHLMFGFRLTDFPSTVDIEELKDEPFDHDRLNKRHKFLQVLLQHIWNRWHHEYLCALRERYNTGTTTPNKFPVVGQVVLIHNDNLRVTWKLGLITKVIPGKDGRWFYPDSCCQN